MADRRAELRVAALKGAAGSEFRPFQEQDVSEEIARDEEPLMVPLRPGARAQGVQYALPAAMLHPQWPMVVEDTEGRGLSHRRDIRRAVALSGGVWGGPQDYSGLQVRTSPSTTGGLPDDSGHEGRTLVRRQGDVLSGLMEAADTERAGAGAIPHEVGHWLLGGDWQHKDPRWRSPRFWQEMDQRLSNAPGTNKPVDWEEY